MSSKEPDFDADKIIMASKKVNTVKTRRLEPQRKTVRQVTLRDVQNLKTGSTYFKRATVLDVSSTGILMSVKREDIVDKKLRSVLTFETIHQEPVGFHIEMMETYMEGIVVRSKMNGKGQFQIAIDFREDAPKYWRQAFFDILPEE